MITTAHRGSLEKYIIYRQILKAREEPTSTYWKWSHDNASCENDTMVEFDVVKKRRLMDAASNDENHCPESLQQFEEFEANVLPAILNICDNYQAAKLEEVLQMEQDLNSRLTPSPGTVYVAVSKSIKYPKIGATRRENATQRLKELSRHVPSPFQLMFSVSTFTPFKTESEIHQHFKAFRIKEKGSCTEFFNVELDVIGDYLNEKYGLQCPIP